MYNQAQHPHNQIIQVQTKLIFLFQLNLRNNTQNIQLNNYGKEDMSHISDTLKTQLLKIPYGMIPKMIEAVHFNDHVLKNKIYIHHL